jgi:hypothetical protein
MIYTVGTISTVQYIDIAASSFRYRFYRALQGP